MTPSHKKINLTWGGKEGEAKSDWLLKDNLHEISSFDAARLEITPTIVKSNTDVELLCTYNWISSKPSAIYVLGKYSDLKKYERKLFKTFGNICTR